MGGGTESLAVTESSVTGQYELKGVTVKMSSTAREGGYYDVVVQLNGLQLTGLVDTNMKVSEVDGFADSGHDTQMTKEDREVLVLAAHAADRETAHANSPAAEVLVRLLNLWSEHPDSVVLQRQLLGDQSHSNGFCSAFNTWQWATHDGPWLIGCDMDDWNPRTTSAVDIGYRWNGQTWYWVNNQWTTAGQDHPSYMYEAGDCFGHCGADCPSGSQTLTQNCADHDQCVRNGHDIAAISCDDEFISAAADYIFANNCPGT